MPITFLLAIRPRWFQIINFLEPSLIVKLFIYRQIFGNNLGFLEVPECSFVGKVVGHDHL